jgi:hypothetical protein
MSIKDIDDLYSVDNAERYMWASVSGEVDRERIACLEKHLEGARILDAGCGGGAYVNYFCKKGYDAVGVDKYAKFLDVAAKKGFEGKFIESDILSMPFSDGEFDSAFCFDVLEHVDDVAALRELARVTRRRIIISVPLDGYLLFKHGLTFSTYMDLTHLRYYTPESVRELGRGIGAKSVDLIPTHPIALTNLIRESLVGGDIPTIGYVEEGVGAFSLFKRKMLLKVANHPRVRSLYHRIMSDPSSFTPHYSNIIAVYTMG